MADALEQLCPACGQPLSRHSLQPSQVRDVAGLSEFQLRIFDRLNRRFGAWVQTRLVVDYLYADDPDGGPESANKVLNVEAHSMRRKLRPFGLTVRGKSSGGTGGAEGQYRLELFDRAARP